mgnify:CR=1 FL=1
MRWRYNIFVHLGVGNMELRNSHILSTLQNKTTDYEERVALGIKGTYGWKEFTYKGLSLLSKKISRYLIEDAEIKKGETLAILSESKPEYGACVFASVLTGTITVPLDIKLSEYELESILSDCKPSVMLASMHYLETALKLQKKIPETNFVSCKTQIYWTGWALAYYQWWANLSFKTIVERVPISDISNLYSPYHEMDIRQFCDKMNELISASKEKVTNLQKFRKIAGLTQKEFAKKIGISVRSVQQYEQRQKNINMASVQTVRNMATVLNCRIEDLLEVEVNCN